MNNSERSNTVSLLEKYKFSNKYFSSAEKLKNDIIKKTVIPLGLNFNLVTK